MKPKFRSLIAAFAPLSRSSLIVCASLCAATSAYADRTWTGTTTDWNTAANWTPATVPGAADIAIFDATSTANLATSSAVAFSLKGVQVTSPSAAVSIALPVINKVATAALTVDFATDTFTYALAQTTPLANGDIVTFGGTMPAGLTGGFPYFVVSATATTFKVSLASGGTAVDFTTAGTSVTATGGYSSVAMGTSGVDLSLATQNLTITAPVGLPVSQSWNVGTGRTLTVNGAVNGSGVLTKSGVGNLLLTNANNLSSGVSVVEGQLTVRNGLAVGLGTTLALANGTTFRIESVNGASGAAVFVGNPISVAAASSATMTSSVVGNGYSGVISGDATSVFNIGAVGNLVQVSFSAGSNLQQLSGLLGRVEITDGASIRFSSTSGVNNGGAAAIWDTNLTGSITSRNAATINLGSVVGNGTLSGSSGFDGTGTFLIGARNEDCTFDGSIVSATAARISAVTKVGTATLTLTSATGLTYTGATNVNAGTLKINGVKSGGGSTTVKLDTTLAGTGSIAGTTTVQSGGIVAPGDGGVGNLTFSNLTLNTGSKLNLEFAGGNDKATVATGGTLTLQSGVNVDVNGFGTAGVYDILNVTGVTVAGTPATAFNVVNGDGSKIYTFANTGTAIQMTISTSDPNNFWTVDGGGSWNTPANWTKSPTIPNAVSAIAKFGLGPSGAGGGFSSSFSATLDGNKTVGLVYFSDEFGAVISIDPGTTTPGTLNIDDGAVAGNIVVAIGDHLINAP
ncbi:hypothetical protein HQ447_15390, partial [bacterium]|nr:hypothetical protein [bacterium]